MDTKNIYFCTEILENIWLKKSVNGKDGSKEKIGLHKELLHWLVKIHYNYVYSHSPLTSMIQSQILKVPLKAKAHGIAF